MFLLKFVFLLYLLEFVIQKAFCCFPPAVTKVSLGVHYKEGITHLTPFFTQQMSLSSARSHEIWRKMARGAGNFCVRDAEKLHDLLPIYGRGLLREDLAVWRVGKARCLLGQWWWQHTSGREIGTHRLGRDCRETKNSKEQTPYIWVLVVDIEDSLSSTGWKRITTSPRKRWKATGTCLSKVLNSLI